MEAFGAFTRLALVVVLVVMALAVGPTVVQFGKDVHAVVGQLAGWKETADRGVVAMEQFKVKFWQPPGDGVMAGGDCDCGCAGGKVGNCDCKSKRSANP